MISKLRGLSDDKKRLVSNFFSLSVLQGANYLLPLITLPYLVRVLGVEKFGLVAFAQAFIQYFAILADYGFDLSATREISIHRENGEKISEIFYSVMLIKFALMILSFVILFLIVFGFEKFKSDWPIYLLSFGIVIGQVLFPVWFFQGMERMKYIAFLNVVSKSIFTISIFVVVRKTSDYIYVPLMSSCGFIIAGVLGQLLAHRNFHLKCYLPSFGCLWHHLKDSAQFFLSRASISIYSSSNAFFLGLFTDIRTVGYYCASEKLYMAAISLYQPLMNAIYPYMAKSRNKSLYRKIFILSVIFNSFFCVCLFIFSRQLITLLYGSDIQQSILILRIFLVSMLVAIPSFLLGSVIAGSLFHLAVLIVASQLYINAPIVAVLVVITNCIILVLRMYGVKRHKLWKTKGV
jgi:PST family polysaccharide transporter